MDIRKIYINYIYRLKKYINQHKTYVNTFKLMVYKFVYKIKFSNCDSLTANSRLTSWFTAQPPMLSERNVSPFSNYLF